MLLSGIDVESHRMRRFAAGRRQPNGERRTPRLLGLLLFEENLRFGRRIRFLAAFPVCSKQMLSSFVPSARKLVMIGSLQPPPLAVESYGLG